LPCLPLRVRAISTSMMNLIRVMDGKKGVLRT
jgi:hypothetical protein